VDDYVEHDAGVPGASRLVQAETTRQIIAAAIDVHKELGPGLLESGYHACMCRELSLRRIPFQSEVSLPVDYKGIHLDCGYRIDLLVDSKVVVKLKSVEKLLPVHQAQLLTYLRLSKKCESDY
jgi:GxxExxY protein